MNLYIKESSRDTNNQPIEVVERKGLGHPDTLADGIAESVSIEYSKYCLENFGVILHHNVDKTVILGGQCELEYGRGVLLKPFRVLFGGRMSRSFGNKRINTEAIQINAAQKYLQRILPRLDLLKDLEFHAFTSSNSRIPRWFTPRSIDDLPEYESPRSNDTATTVGFWPLSITEQIVLASEEFFYEFKPNIHPRFDFIGSDIKIMALRKDRDLELTLCIPFHANKVRSRELYLDYKSSIENELHEFLEKRFSKPLTISLYVNTQDQKIKSTLDDGRNRYLTVIGSALDYGEEGISGRGNRCRGLISSMRTSTVESAYGKNPVYHVGKVYSHIANVIARKISSLFNCEATVIITTRNGDPLYPPYNILIETSKITNKRVIKNIIDEQLQKSDWTERIIKDSVFLPENELRSEE